MLDEVEFANPESHKLTILLASGDPFFRDQILRVLPDRRYRVTVVDSCYGVLDVTMERHFDCIIFDPELKGMAGAETARIVKKTKRETPFVVVSDENSFETDVKIAELGVYFRLGKPPNERILIQLVQSVRK